jgi:hypothetical protein
MQWFANHCVPIGLTQLIDNPKWLTIVYYVLFNRMFVYLIIVDEIALIGR